MVDRVRSQQQKPKLPTSHPDQKLPADSPQQFVNLPQIPSPDNVLLLQRTVGNHITREIIGQSRKPVIQRLPTYADFQKKTGQIKKAKQSLGGKLGIGRSDFNDQMNDYATEGQVEKYTGKAATDLIEHTRATNDIKPERPDAPDTGILGMHININTAYVSYEMAKGKPTELKQLINLYDTITLWQTANIGGKSNLIGENNDILEPLKQQIKSEIQQHTDKLSAGAPPARPLGKPHAANFQFPPQAKFLEEIGMPPQYYLDHFHGNNVRMRQIIIAYEHLKSGENDRAMLCINLLNKDVPGFYLIRSLLVSKFPHLAGLEKIIGTNAHTTIGSAVTPEEADAINWYTSEAYKDINTVLRNRDLLPDDAARRAGLVKFGGSKSQQKQTKMELAVSGLNKLPKFSGVSYRNIVDPSKDFEAALSPGGAMSDVGFVSASPSMKGVGNFMSSSAAKGSMHIFFMMHTKTAVNVISLSKSPHEGEILFRPGTRFFIQNVWQHDSNGNVPRNAPVEAQMVLHSQMQHKNTKGKSVSPEAIKQNAALADTDTDKYKGAYFKTKVVELVEV